MTDEPQMRHEPAPFDGPMSVLLVEDNPADARLVQEWLKAEDASIDLIHVETLDQAKGWLGTGQIDVVLLDLTLPDSKGLVTVTEIQRTAPAVAMVVLSGMEDDDLALRIVESGAQDYVVKGQSSGAQLMRSMQFAVKRKRAEMRLMLLAQHDPLTGLANRVLFEDRLEQAILRADRRHERLALMFIDLDGFKTVNDTYGHDAGDVILRTVAKQLKASVRASDTVARVGGDEFILVLEGIKSAERVVGIARKIMDAVAQPIDTEYEPISLGCSIGITMYPEGAGDATSLVRKADKAMYRAKQSGRNAFCFARQEEQAPPQSAEMDGALRQAIVLGQFMLYFQPQIDMRSGKITGVESLLRWQQTPTRMNSPRDFMSVAEETGLIVPIGEWVLRSACNQFQHWAEDGIELPRVSVNVSAQQLHCRGFVDMVLRTLAETDTDPQALEIEVPEEIITQELAFCHDAVQRLRQSGVRICVDNFGSGSCSLGQLSKLPADTIKVDRKFIATVDEDESQSTYKLIVNLGKALDLRVVASGVESKKQLKQLQALGVDEIQGFYISEPTAGSGMAAIMSRSLVGQFQVTSLVA